MRNEKGKRVTSGGKGAVDDHSIAELWARAAHDLRQPVQAALLLARMLDDAPAQPEQRRTARHIGTSLKSLYAMLEFLTVLSRLEAGLQTVALRNCQLADALAVTLREMAKVAAKRGIALRSRNLQGLVRTNPQLLATAIKSLLLNAIKYGSGDAIVARGRWRKHQVNIEIHFRVANPDPSSARNAFFELSAPAGGQPSVELGVGLLLLERLCRRLGHELSQAPCPPDGQVLIISLPRASGS
jgi:two-component system, sensor histidine kinase